MRCVIYALPLKDYSTELFGVGVSSWTRIRYNRHPGCRVGRWLVIIVIVGSQSE